MSNREKGLPRGVFKALDHQDPRGAVNPNHNKVWELTELRVQLADSAREQVSLPEDVRLDAARYGVDLQRENAEALVHACRVLFEQDGGFGKEDAFDLLLHNAEAFVGVKGRESLLCLMRAIPITREWSVIRTSLANLMADNAEKEGELLSLEALTAQVQACFDMALVPRNIPYVERFDGLTMYAPASYLDEPRVHTPTFNV